MAKLYFRHGTVGSAKSLNLIAVAHNYENQGKAVVVAKPAIDTRFGIDDVASRAPLSRKATILIHPDTKLVPELFKGVHCLVVDEVQFLSEEHIDMLRAIADNGCPVICYGLRTDFRRKLFPGSARLLELADAIEEVKTTCYYCNRKAIFNLKLVNGSGTLSGQQVDLGAEEKYLPTCSNHYQEKTSHCSSAASEDTATEFVQDDDSSSNGENSTHPQTPVKPSRACSSNVNISPSDENKKSMQQSQVALESFKREFNRINNISAATGDETGDNDGDDGNDTSHHSSTVTKLSFDDNEAITPSN